MSIKAEFATMRRTIQAQQEELARVGKRMFQEACAAIFTTHPEVAAIVWTQYTPYWNDGDACTFEVNSPSFYRLDTGEGEESGGDGENGDVEGMVEMHGVWWPRTKQPVPATLAALKEFHQLINDASDVMEVLFGDHCRVVITRAGVDVQNHEHD